jgi:hypothetical protein
MQRKAKKISQFSGYSVKMPSLTNIKWTPALKSLASRHRASYSFRNIFVQEIYCI